MGSSLAERIDLTEVRTEVRSQSDRHTLPDGTPTGTTTIEPLRWSLDLPPQVNLFFVPVVLMPVAQEETLQVTFTSLCQQWKRDTGRLSVLVKKVMHRAYQQIIGLGAPALPLILKELARADDHWFWALEAISRENPARDCTTFEDAANAWLRWGAERGFIQD